MKKWMNFLCSVLMVLGLAACYSKPSEENPPQTPAEAPKPSPPAEMPAPGQTPPAEPGAPATPAPAP